MSTTTDEARVAARRRAQEAFTSKQDTERNDARDKLRRAEDAKTARLKALRLAKEAADKAAAATRKPGAGRAGKRTPPVRASAVRG